MAIRPTKTDAKKLHELLDKEWDSVEELAMAVMERSFEVYVSKAKFAVVGQTRRKDNPAFEGTPRRGFVLDLFATQTQADNESTKLTHSAANPSEPHAVWTLPIFHGTSHAYHTSRKKEREASEAGVTMADRLSALIRSKESVPRCPRLDLGADAEFIRCIHFNYHPGDCHFDEDLLPRCDRRVLIPHITQEMAPCKLHLYHYGPCVAEVQFHEEEPNAE